QDAQRAAGLSGAAHRLVTSTARPSVRSTPGSFTTRSSGAIPLAISTVGPVSRSTTTGAKWTRSPGPPTAARSPSAPFMSPVAGTESTRWDTGSVIATCAYIPLNSSPLGLGTRTSVVIVRVVGSSAPADRATLPSNTRPGNSRTVTLAGTSTRTLGARS